METSRDLRYIKGGGGGGGEEKTNNLMSTNFKRVPSCFSESHNLECFHCIPPILKYVWLILGILF